MQLKHIPDIVCPICKSDIETESRRNQHCSGEWNETRSFLCGYQVSYSPNFREVAEDSRSQCKNDPKFTDLIRKREAAIAELRKNVAALDADAKFKDHVMSQFQYMRPTL